MAIQITQVTIIKPPKVRGPLYWFITLGQLIAAILSWEVNHSILWAMVHSLLSWFYILYFILL